MGTDSHRQPTGSYASINGLDLYYEIHGSGQPLVVLPGAFSTIQAMGELVPQLAATLRVIAVELQGHGHTADIERPLRFELLADDIAALILQTPVLIVVGDADGVRLAHAVELFGLLGGGQADGDMSGLPTSALAVLPATTHVGWDPPHHGILTRIHLLLPIIAEFLEA